MIVDLSLRLAAGATAIAAERRDRLLHWLVGLQRPDGGFAGRRGVSDCYYTGFALRVMAMLGYWSEGLVEAAGRFVAARVADLSSPVDAISAVQSLEMIERLGGPKELRAVDRREIITELIDQLSRPDGGFAKTRQSGPSSTYQTFLLAATAEMLGLALPDPRRTAQTIAARQRPDGGFCELPMLRRSGVNPTAAAVATLSLLGALTPETATAACKYLLQIQSSEGGWPAHAAAPCCDLLSTFSSLTVLRFIAPVEQIDFSRTKVFVELLQTPDGGFRGGLYDDEPDCEYSFYGMGCLSLLAH